MSSLTRAPPHWSPLVLAFVGPGVFFSIAFLAHSLTLLQGELLLAVWGIFWLLSGILLFREFRRARRLRDEHRVGVPGSRLATVAGVLLASGFLLLVLGILIHNAVPPCAGVVSCGGGPTTLDWTGGLLTAVQLLTLSFVFDVAGMVLMAIALWKLSTGRLRGEHHQPPPVVAPETHP
jgi:hypothetical protein